MTSNVERKPNYDQVCVWPATCVPEEQVEPFEEWFASEGFRVQFLEMIKTFPDKEDGKEVEGTGGRMDTFFAVHSDDIGKFAAWRLQLGIRWIEDACSTQNGYDDNPIYPARVLGYRNW